MRMPRGGFWIVGMFLLAARPAIATGRVELRVSCPAEAAAGSTITAELRLSNHSCFSGGYNVRVMASIAGNADQSLGGVGIAGPVVVAPSINVPEGTPPFPGSPCSNSVDVSIAVPPAIPMSLEGRVATFILISEWDQVQFGVVGTDETEVAQCMVNVTSP
jgi:hypothetical protein